ncbi:hypothetical protein WG66_016132 [Moniliophthora roreri]|uniref:Uncharacterized protein n=1 Tax=Moniliophthora roreri TaxID=221103 RepID=A0A0W0FBF5_MONRR|nr:hypothetical protein WG66_016132 [Moniliophthora roreri]
MSSRNTTRARRTKGSKTISKTFFPTSKPLQDITDEVVHGIPGSDFNARPRRRRPKVPQGALGQKLKPAMPSSPLPPSSPVASSSTHGQNYLPIATSEDGEMPLNQVGHSAWQVDNGDDADDWKENIDFSSQWYDGDGNFVAPKAEDVEEQISSANGSDPFGFFAVEQQLKAERAAQPPKPPRSLEPKAVSPPPLKPPRTPHKQRVGKRPIDISSGSSSPERDIVPSSPSPTKRSSEGHSFREPPQTDLHGEDVLVEDESDNDTPPKATGSRRRNQSNESPVNPQRLAKSLTSLLPKRPTRRTKASRAPKYDEPSDSDDNHVTKKKREVRSRKRAKTVKKEENEEIDVDLEVDEKLAQEKQARLEYFKQLDGYEMAKENVYVI